MGLPVSMARLLAARGIQNAQQATKFLNPSLGDLHSPYQMTGLRSAVTHARIPRPEAIITPSTPSTESASPWAS